MRKAADKGLGGKPGEALPQTRAAMFPLPPLASPASPSPRAATFPPTSGSQAALARGKADPSTHAWPNSLLRA